MTDDELDAFEEGRNLGEDLLESIRQMKAGQGTVVYSPALAARERTGLSQARFAELLGVSVRTLQEWEQGRRQPSGAARTLFKVAERHPEVLRELG
jgi:putative transcriptional regulator